MSSYFRWNNPFLIAHMAIAAVAALLVFALSSRINRLSRKASVARSLTESEIRALTYPIEKFDQYFDLCSSTFIFIGLIGTIIGFISALPFLRDPDYDFRHFRDAMAVSGFGILWSVLLNVLLSVYHATSVAPQLERLRAREEVDRLATILAESLTTFSTQIVESLRSGLGDFAGAANSVSRAAMQLSKSADRTSTQFDRSIDGMANAVANAVKVSEQMWGLPGKLTDGLHETFATQRSELSHLFEEQVRQVREGGVLAREMLAKEEVSTAKRYEHSVKNIHAAHEAAIEQARESMGGYFAEVEKRHNELLGRHSAAVDEANKAFFESAARCTREFAQQLAGVEKRLPDEIKTAYFQNLDRAAAAAEKLAEGAVDRQKLAELLDRSAASLNSSLERFGGVVRSLSSAMSSLDKAKISGIDQRLLRIQSLLEEGRGHTAGGLLSFFRRG